MKARSSAFAALLVVLVVMSLAAGAAAATGPSATVDGPVTGGKGVPSLASTSFDLASVGYQQSEFFVSGTASAYTSAKPLTSDGKWTVKPASTAAYKTRVVVYRPTDPAKFNGTVLVEWDNVSGGLDAAPFWTAAHDELIREGYAWVGLAAQSVGVNGDPNAFVKNLDLKHADPARYGTLNHPGDSYSYDMYTQVGRAVRSDAATLLGGLQPKHVIAAGESQSAFRLTTYIDAVQPITKGVYDGYLVYSRGDDGTALSQAPQPDIFAPVPTLIRTDLDVPVLTFTTESDLAVLGYAKSLQPDNKLFRNWEVAGTSHADTYTLGVGPADTGTPASDAAFFQTMINPPSKLYNGIVSCDKPINAGPTTYVLRTAVDDLNRWVSTGTPPPKAPRLQTVRQPTPTTVAGDKTIHPAVLFKLDAQGNAKGGIRTPQVDTPIATLSGLGQSGNGFCGLFGTTAPLDTTKLASLYPTHAAFVKAWDQATDRAVKAGFLLPADAPGIKAAATASNIGGAATP